MLFEMFKPVAEKDAGMMNVLQLAYIGDAVWEVFVRNDLIRKGLNVHHMHSECIRRVSARAQAGFIRELEEKLSPEEAELVRRGRNAHSNTSAKNASIVDYRVATGFEALVGWLYVTGQLERMNDILQMALPEEIFGQQAKR